MYFEQHLQPQFVRLTGEQFALFGTEAGGDEQHGIGTRDAGLQQLVTADDEVLAEDGDIYQRACRMEVAQVASEELLVRQDGEGGGTGGFVGGGYFLRPRFPVYPAFGGRTAFELGDDAGGRGGERLLHAAVLRRVFPKEVFGLFLQLLQRDCLLLQLDFHLFVGDDFR